MQIYVLLFFSFLKIGLFSFGGGYAMIPLLEKEVVRVQGWLTFAEMVDVIALSQMTPGPIAINLATFVGYKIQGIWGSTAATLGVITPSFIIVLLISKFYFKFKQSQRIEGMFKGIRPMVVALIGAAAYFIAGTSISDYKSIILMIITFVAIKYAKLEPILIIFLVGVLGMIVY